MLLKKRKKTATLSEETVMTNLSIELAKQPRNAYILFLKGQLLGKLYSLKKGTITIGRAMDCKIVVEDPRISRKHVQIKVNDKKSIIKDLGSTNGTFVNGKRINKYVLQEGDKIHLSPMTIFKFLLGDEIEKIFHKELYQMGVVDPVTNVYNKRYFSDRLKQEFSFAKRHNRDLSLMIIDIDHFKKINDTYGHQAGDYVLGRIGDFLSTQTRQEDIVARYGGEEFVLILRDIGEEGASALANRIRYKVSKMPLSFEGKKMNITVSMGVVSLSEEYSFRTKDEFFEAGDRCLYHSKETGRNRTTCLFEIHN